MILTEKQEQGLKEIISRYKNGEKYVVIAGYAGSGKTTLVKFAIEALGVDAEDVVYAAYTGKAAEALRKKGNKNAMTLHKLLYKFFMEDGYFRKVPKADIGYKVVVIDEISMVTKDMMDLLFSHDCFAICLGDPFQLPPVSKKESNDLLEKPHVFLDEIMRQAKESEIIRLSMDLREMKPLTLFSGKEVQIMDKKDLSTGMLLWADQTIVATNQTRNFINQKTRELLGFTKELEKEDKIICCHNYWDKIDDFGMSPLINGSAGTIEEIEKINVRPPIRVRQTMKNKEYEAYKVTFTSSIGEMYSDILLDPMYLTNNKETLEWLDTKKLYRQRNPFKYIPLSFNYGYAITCWKAQGSEWDKVLILEENFPFQKEEHYRYLYTALTRASQKVVLIKS